MKKPRARIKRLLNEEAWLEEGPQRRAVIDEAVALADELGDEDLQFQARMALTDCVAITGDRDAELSSFAWCLAKYDEDPVRFSDSQHGDVLWHYKFVLFTLDGSSIFTLSQIEAALDDMEARYRRADAGQSAVFWQRFQHAWYTGRLDQAKDWRVKFLATPRDDYSDCDACTRSQLARFAAEVGDEVEALRLVDEIINDDYSCAEEPERALATVLVPMLRAGQLEEARATHTRSYRLARNNPDLIDTVGLHMRFCAITGNEARALALAERHIGWLAHDALNEAGQHDFLLSLGVALSAVGLAGHGDEVVRGAETAGLRRFFGEHDGLWRADELADAAWGAAARIAAAFDTRNGNTYVSGQAASARALLDEHYDVPIHTDAFLAAPPPSAAEPVDAEGWGLRARDFRVTGQVAQSVEAARKALALSDGGNRLQALERLITCLVDAGDEAGAAELLRERVALLRTAGDDGQADAETRLGLALFGRTTDDDVAALDAEAARQDGVPGPTPAGVRASLVAAWQIRGDADQHLERITALMRQTADDPAVKPSDRRHALSVLAQYGAADDPEAALDNLRQAADLCEAASDRAVVLHFRAMLCGRLGRYDEGAAAADEATKLFASLRFAGPTAQEAHLAGMLLLDAGRPEEALTRLRYAVRELEFTENTAIPTRFQMGRALLAAGHAAEAIEVLGEVLRIETENESPAAELAATQQWLAQSYERAGEPGLAVDNYAGAAESYEEAGEIPAAIDNLVNEAIIYMRYDDNETALDRLRRALALAEAEAGQPYLARVLDRLGWVKAKMGDATGLDDLDRAAELARAEGSAHNVAAVLDTRAGALEHLGRPGDAVAACLSSSDAYLEADEPGDAARLEYFAGLFLDSQNDLPAAAAILSTALGHTGAAIEQGTDVANLRTSIALKLGDVREALGDTAAAAEARSQAG